jgi:hypothetical protein
MNPHSPDFINDLINRFATLQEQWEDNPGSFSWDQLQGLATDGASAYNEGAGPAFHALALDGVQHTEFHERFLEYSVGAGFDPFRAEQGASGDAWFSVLDHAALEVAARSNPSSARMHQRLQELARARFEPLAKDIEQGTERFAHPLFRIAEACAESLPHDLLVRIAPALAKHPGITHGAGRPDTDERMLSTAEQVLESRHPYG